ncbi:MAG: pantetheine-phosphate adenylyltransferase [Cyanobacteria bacterium P01_D01_bin.73]
MIAVYPGSFDPITLGHLDIMERGAQLFDRLVVAVLKNPNKAPLFSVEERVTLIRRATKHLPSVEADSFSGLTVDYARRIDAKVLIRGLRVMSDFEAELQMAHTNKTLNGDIETMFLATRSDYSFLSSSVVKEVARFGGPVDHLVPAPVVTEIQQCFPTVPPVPPTTSPPIAQGDQ